MMNKKIYSLWIFWFMLTISLSSQNNANKPNIILIVADDLGYGDLSVYGQKKIKTPNLDRLAAEGMRFTQAYAGTVCAPSRCSLMTGFHNGNNRIRDNLPNSIYLRPDDFTLAELLKQANYQTGAIGKWGLGVEGSWGTPNQQGFDYWYGHLNQDHAHFYYPDFLWENEKLVLLQELVIENQVGEITGNRGGVNKFYTNDLFTGKAIDFINRNQAKPFFLYLPYTIPHYSDYPKNVPEHFMVPSDEPYTRMNWPQIAKNYAAMITRMDRDIGTIMDLLIRNSIEENTLIIFTSDNGPYQGIPVPVKFFNSNGPYRGGKRELYEGGIRVPFIAKWKNVIPPGVVSDRVIALWDLMPTFADIIKYPAEIRTDGISILPVFKGGYTKNHEYLYWDYGHLRKTFQQAVRYGNYKGILIKENNSLQFELYDLSVDPGEQVNIAKQNPELVKKIQGFMDSAYHYSVDYDRERLR